MSPFSLLGDFWGTRLALQRRRRLPTIENLTTFHEIVRRRPAGAVILYTAGTPSPSWKRVSLDELAANVPLFHWGDNDVGGFRIASHLAERCEECGRRLHLHGMEGTLESSRTGDRRPLGPPERAEVQRLCERWACSAEAAALGHFAVEQESLPCAPDFIEGARSVTSARDGS